MPRLVIAVWLIPALLSGAALAQPQRPQPPGGDPMLIAEQTADRVRGGGSLLRASLAAPAETSQARLESVSFFAVPAPEPRTLRKHDLVTIIVREQASFTSEGETETEKQADLQARLDEFIKLKLNNWELEGGGVGAVPPSIRASASRDFEGEGTVDRRDSFTTRVTAEVVDVKPNGTLVLQARKRIKTDDEEQVLILTGICRAEDVLADNTVLSTQLHDLNLEKQHTGAVRDATKRGAVPKWLDALNPF